MKTRIVFYAMLILTLSQVSAQVKSINVALKEKLEEHLKRSYGNGITICDFSTVQKEKTFELKVLRKDMEFKIYGKYEVFNNELFIKEGEVTKD